MNGLTKSKFKNSCENSNLLYFSQVFDDPQVVAKYYAQLGQHFASNQEYSTAERLYIQAGMFKEAIDMYNQAGKTVG
jgi:intraflagellar transport protein 172